MPAPITTTLLVAAAIATALSPLAAVIVAGVALLVEISLTVVE